MSCTAAHAVSMVEMGEASKGMTSSGPYGGSSIPDLYPFKYSGSNCLLSFLEAQRAFSSSEFQGCKRQEALSDTTRQNCQNHQGGRLLPLARRGLHYLHFRRRPGSRLLRCQPLPPQPHDTARNPPNWLPLLLSPGHRDFVNPCFKACRTLPSTSASRPQWRNCATPSSRNPFPHR